MFLLSFPGWIPCSLSLSLSLQQFKSTLSVLMGARARLLVPNLYMRYFTRTCTSMSPRAAAFHSMVQTCLTAWLRNKRRTRRATSAKASESWSSTRLTGLSKVSLRSCLPLVLLNPHQASPVSIRCFDSAFHGRLRFRAK